MIRKGQACWSATGAKLGLLHRFIVSLFAATYGVTARNEKYSVSEILQSPAFCLF
jgi:hypothetical protein